MLQPLPAYHNWIEKEIRKKKFGREPRSLYEPIEYLMALGGKRLRPMLTLLSYSLFRNNVKSIVRYAVAVEAFHNFTLMHDDIMDKAPLRRGRETVHKKWNVNTAILSGDVMLVKVYEMFMDLGEQKLQHVLEAFGKCAAGVCEGQQWDMEFETREDVTELQYIKMIRLKTAVLLGFSLELGGILANASAGSCKSLREFGVSIGIGFQLKDDLMDAYADPEKFGKQVGGDILSNKKTFLLIKALQKADTKTKKELKNWLSVRKFRKQDKIRAIKNIYDRLNIPSLTEKKIDHYFRKGFESLERIDIDPAKKAVLRRFAESLMQRQS